MMSEGFDKMYAGIGWEKMRREKMRKAKMLLGYLSMFSVFKMWNH